MQYGHFDDALREYVIDTPTTRHNRIPTYSV